MIRILDCKFTENQKQTEDMLVFTVEKQLGLFSVEAKVYVIYSSESFENKANIMAVNCLGFSICDVFEDKLDQLQYPINCENLDIFRPIDSDFYTFVIYN
jgi:hypothetical protein